MYKKSTVASHLDERIVEAAVRRIQGKLAAARIAPEWLPLLGLAQRYGVSRVTMWRRLKAAGITGFRLSRKLVLYRVPRVDRAMQLECDDAAGSNTTATA